jgi:NADH-quinone oxidoreductase subunit E
MDEAVRRYPPNRQRSAAMPLLHLWQEHFGFITDEAVHWIAAKLGLQPINILELVTFYPMFRQERAGKTHIRVCRTLGCAMAGSYQVMENLCAATGISRTNDKEGMHNPVSVSADGNYSIEFVECLASCGTAPVCMVNDALHENVRPDSAADLLTNHQLVAPKRLEGGSPVTNHRYSPHPLEHRLVFRNIGRTDWTTEIDCYLGDGGYEQL